MKRLFIYFCIAIFFCSCHSDVSKINIVSTSKTWCHRCNDTLTIKEKESSFPGFEVDVIYSSALNDLFVAHDADDTLHNITLRQWFKAFSSPQEKYFWIDIKNPSDDNAQAIADLILEETTRYGIGERLFLEHWNESCLKTFQDNGLHVSLWLDNIYEKGSDSASWYNSTRSRLERFHPDAISCNAQMYPLVTNSFPEMNILLWDTPRSYTEENVEHTRMLVDDPLVKVVLVDYPEPIE